MPAVVAVAMLWYSVITGVVLALGVSCQMYKYPLVVGIHPVSQLA
jgi:hypothetical protein